MEYCADLNKIKLISGLFDGGIFDMGKFFPPSKQKTQLLETLFPRLARLKLRNNTGPNSNSLTC